MKLNNIFFMPVSGLFSCTGYIVAVAFLTSGIVPEINLWLATWRDAAVTSPAKSILSSLLSDSRLFSSLIQVVINDEQYKGSNATKQSRLGVFYTATGGFTFGSSIPLRYRGIISRWETWINMTCVIHRRYQPSIFTSAKPAKVISSEPITWVITLVIAHR